MNIKEAIKCELGISRMYGSLKRKDLLHKLTFYDMQLTDRKLRSTVKEMIEVNGEPIGTSSKRGYFLVRTQKDFNCATKDLHKKAISMLYRIKKLKLNIEKQTGKQIYLKFDKNE